MAERIEGLYTNFPDAKNDLEWTMPPTTRDRDIKNVLERQEDVIVYDVQKMPPTTIGTTNDMYMDKTYVVAPQVDVHSLDQLNTIAADLYQEVGGTIFWPARKNEKTGELTRAYIAGFDVRGRDGENRVFSRTGVAIHPTKDSVERAIQQSERRNVW